MFFYFSLIYRRLWFIFGIILIEPHSMKKLIYILVLLTYNSLQAQDSIPDADFEQTEFTCDTVKRTYTVRNFIWQLGPQMNFFGVIEKSFFNQKPYQGLYTAQIQSFTTSGYGNYLYQTFPYTKRPVSFACMASYIFKRGEVATNNFCIDIILTRNSGQDTICFTRKNGDYQFHRDTSSSSKPYYFAFPLVYNSADTPENCTIRIWTAIPDSKYYPMNSVAIDALKFLDTIAYSHTLPDTFGNDPVKKDTTHIGIGTVKPNQQAMFEVYPNPTNQLLYIHFKKEFFADEKKQLIITNAEGKSIYTQAVTNTENLKLNTSTFANGIYYISIKTSTELYTQKFVVRR